MNVEEALILASTWDEDRVDNFISIHNTQPMATLMDVKALLVLAAETRRLREAIKRREEALDYLHTKVIKAREELKA